MDEHITRYYGNDHITREVTQTVPQQTDVPDVCTGSFDAVGVLRGEVFIFKGAYLWRLTEKYRIKEGYPVKIWQVFKNFPKHIARIDAVYERDIDNSIILFAGNNRLMRIQSLWWTIMVCFLNKQEKNIGFLTDKTSCTPKRAQLLILVCRSA